MNGWIADLTGMSLWDGTAWEATTDRIAQQVPQIVIGSLLVGLFWFASNAVRRLINRLGRLRRVNADAVGILAETAKWSVVAIGLVTGLGTVGIDVSALVAGLGLTGLALGIALKDVVSNSIAGIMILIYRPFARNDRISVTNLEGTVVQIDLRYTTLELPDRKILIPNSNLFTNSIIVYRGAAPVPREGEEE